MGHHNIKVGITLLKEQWADFYMRVTNHHHEIYNKTVYHCYMDSANEASAMMKRGGLEAEHIWNMITRLFKAEVKHSYAYHLDSNLGNPLWDYVENAYKTILPKFKRHFGSRSYWVGRTLLNWGEVTRRGVSHGVVKRSEKRLRRGLVIMRKIYMNKPHERILKGQLSLAKSLCFAREYNRSAAEFYLCEDVLLENFGPTHPLLRKLYVGLITLYRRANWFETTHHDGFMNWCHLREEKLLRDERDYLDNWERWNFRWPDLVTLANASKFDRYMRNAIMMTNFGFSL